MSARRVSVACFLLASAACSVGALDGFSGGAPPAAPAVPEAGVASDGAVPPGPVVVEDAAGADAADAGDGGGGDGLPPHGPNLLFNAGFESACTGWITYNADAVEAVTARSGRTACMVCATGEESPLIASIVTRSVTVGERYYAEVHVRAVTETAVGADGPALYLFSQEGNVQDVAPPVTSPRLSTSWARVGTLLSASGGAPVLRLEVRLPSATSCVLIDDAALYRLD